MSSYYYNCRRSLNYSFTLDPFIIIRRKNYANLKKKRIFFVVFEDWSEHSVLLAQ